MININSSRYKNLFFTYLISDQLSKGTIMLLDGLPSNPLNKEKLMENLAKKNYDVFFPRYEGTWESKGEFLKRSPSEIIIEFISILKRGIKIKNKEYKAKKIFILGSSFGGGIGLDIASQQDLIDKICVTSPVISFRKVKGIETLENFLKNAHKDHYHFNPKNWKKLIKDKILNLEINKIKRFLGLKNKKKIRAKSKEQPKSGMKKLKHKLKQNMALS